MSSMTSMDGMDSTATTTAAMPSSTTTMDMGGMDMGGHGGGNSCKISMLWNWYTVDACFLSSSWHITSSGMFAGSCIGVILLVMLLEALRRGSKEYDAYIIRKRMATSPPPTNEAQSSNSNLIGKNTSFRAVPTPIQQQQFRPTLLEQSIRSLLHMCQFAVAYIIMLLAMYFNGYIIICIFIGAFLGSFAFDWTTTNKDSEGTYCCG